MAYLAFFAQETRKRCIGSVLLAMLFLLFFASVSASRSGDFFQKYESGQYHDAYNTGMEIIEKAANQGQKKREHDFDTSGLLIDDLIKRHFGHSIVEGVIVSIPYPFIGLWMDLATIFNSGGIPTGEVIENKLNGLDRFFSKWEQQDFSLPGL